MFGVVLFVVTRLRAFIRMLFLGNNGSFFGYNFGTITTTVGGYVYVLFVGQRSFVVRVTRDFTIFGHCSSKTWVVCTVLRFFGTRVRVGRLTNFLWVTRYHITMGGTTTHNSGHSHGVGKGGHLLLNLFGVDGTTFVGGLLGTLSFPTLGGRVHIRGVFGRRLYHGRTTNKFTHAERASRGGVFIISVLHRFFFAPIFLRV